MPITAPSVSATMACTGTAGSRMRRQVCALSASSGGRS